MTTNTQDASPIPSLQQLGFTEYEAQAYVTLVEHGELSGYELAKRSGIPRANIYAVAEKLRQRGAVLQAQGERGRRYAAVAPESLLRGMEAERKRALSAAGRALASLTRADQPVSVYSLRDERLVEQARHLVDASTGQLLIALQPAEAALLAPALRQAHERGVEIITLCLEACEKPCGGCQGQLHRHPLAPEDGSRWLLLVADGGEALLGRSTSTLREGLATAQPMVAELVGAYIRQSLALALLGDELAGRFDGLLSEQARQLLYPESARHAKADA